MQGNEPPSVEGCSACPNEDTIARVLLGEPRIEARQQLLDHVAMCSPCRRLAGALLSDDRAADASQPIILRPIGGLRALSDGECVDGRYRVQRFVARGGMGEVYMADDLLLGESIALKTVLLAESSDGDVLARFRSEVQLARRVSHPNVCRIFEFGLYERRPGDTVPYYTMPMLHGKTLAQHLRDAGALRADEVAPLMLQIAAGLEAIHQEGIVHRDLKPENIFLVPDPKQGQRAMLMDFGLARPLSVSPGRSFSKNGGLVGTPAYIAPEILLGHPATIQADLYSLGVVLFEACSGQLPFAGGTALKAAADRLYLDAPALRRVNPNIDEAWEALAAACLKRSAELRPRDVHQIVQHIARMGAERASSSDRPKRHAAVWAPVALVTAGVAVLAIVVTTRGKTQEGQAVTGASHSTQASHASARQEIQQQLVSPATPPPPIPVTMPSRPPPPRARRPTRAPQPKTLTPLEHPARADSPGAAAEGLDPNGIFDPY